MKQEEILEGMIKHALTGECGHKYIAEVLPDRRDYDPCRIDENCEGCVAYKSFGDYDVKEMPVLARTLARQEGEDISDVCIWKELSMNKNSSTFADLEGNDKLQRCLGCEDYKSTTVCADYQSEVMVRK